MQSIGKPIIMTLCKGIVIVVRNAVVGSKFLYPFADFTNSFVGPAVNRIRFSCPRVVPRRYTQDNLAAGVLYAVNNGAIFLKESLMPIFKVSTGKHNVIRIIFDILRIVSTKHEDIKVSICVLCDCVLAFKTVREAVSCAFKGRSSTYACVIAVVCISKLIVKEAAKCIVVRYRRTMSDGVADKGNSVRVGLSGKVGVNRTHKYSRIHVLKSNFLLRNVRINLHICSCTDRIIVENFTFNYADLIRFHRIRV